MPRLNGKVTLITGGASGIGEGTARLFIEEGAAVTIADIQDDRGQRLAKELGSRAAYIHADVSREAEVHAAVNAVVERFGRLDCLFNNAGFGAVQDGIEEITVAGFDETIGVPLRGVFLGMKHAAPIMKRQGSGSIISTASVAGLRTGLGPHVYSAAKAAVIHLTHSVAMELGETVSGSTAFAPAGSQRRSSAKPSVSMRIAPMRRFPS
jgi:NAD(P)-dependent dehydrogenase (short-subunit alcohol dehydrogenase family)